MSTDDSISEDVSSSGGLSHCHVSVDGGKESETSLLSSEGTSASGLTGPEDRHPRISQTAGDDVENRPVDITPACNKIRSLCLSTGEAFGQGKNLPFINPSSLETLRALVQEIQSSGETDPEIWKDCEGRWLHLFQLVEKQYQEQILAQQEQYQCQIQLIQDEIKALVQLQNRQSGGPPHADLSPIPITASTKEFPSALISDTSPLPRADPHVKGEFLLAPTHAPLTSLSPPPPPLRPEGAVLRESGEERATTVLSSGYGTLSAWETGLERTRVPGGVEEEDEDEEVGQEKEEQRWSPSAQEDTETVGRQRDSTDEMAPRVEAPEHQPHQQRNSSSSQHLTSWAQRQKLRPKKGKAGPASSQAPEHQDQQLSPGETPRHSPLEHMDLQDQHRSTGPLSTSLPMRRSDSLVSEASGLTYWRLDESDLYRPLPDSFDSGAYLLLQEASISLTPPPEQRLSLREIYQNKQKTDPKRSDWDRSLTSSPLSPQMVTLDTAAHVRQSDRTSGFTSPSHFSSPSFPSQSQPYPRVGTPLSPGSTADCSANPGDTDCSASNASSRGPASTSPDPVGPQPSVTGSQQRRGSVPLASEEEGSRTHTSTLKPNPHARDGLADPGASPLHVARLRTESVSSLEDPVVLSLLRQNLREKHSRHVADLRAYYEAEIRALREKLNLRDLPRDLEKSNQALRDRCKQLEKALAEATNRIQELEAKNFTLEKKMAEWPERYAVAGATVKSLQQRLEESRRSGSEKDASAARLRTLVRQLEEAVQTARRDADEKEARREREYKMLQDLLGEYDSLRKDHEAVKDTLVSTENKLVDANDHISELKRVISKLESQVKQLEHENQSRSRYAPHSHVQPSGAGLFHHPDLLLSPTRSKAEPDVTRRKSPAPPIDQLNSNKRSQYSQTGHVNGYRKSLCPQADQSAGPGSSVDSSSSGGSRRCASPTEREQPQQPEPQEQSVAPREASRWEGQGPLTPVVRALIELEETRATQSRAPWSGSRRTAVSFAEQRHREAAQERGRPAGNADQVDPVPGAKQPERGGAGPSAATAILRSLSPEGHRSSSLPPSAQRNLRTATPTKRETLLTPVSAKSSPKRCPTENYSTAFGQPMPRQQHLHNRFDVPLDQRRHSFHSASPRKRLHFTAPDRQEDSPQQPPCSGSLDSCGSPRPSEGSSRPGWEGQGPWGSGHDPQDAREDDTPPLHARLQSLADAERLFDELTQEKLQIEAALSRIPAAGGRVTLQTRLDEVALEKRLERVNRDLGSIRMTLKRFHVLRSSTNT